MAWFFSFGEEVASDEWRLASDKLASRQLRFVGARHAVPGVSAVPWSARSAAVVAATSCPE
jgi:hypothetical protein